MLGGLKYWTTKQSKFHPIISHEDPEREREREREEVQLYPFFNLGARWGWVVSATPRPFYPLERNTVLNSRRYTNRQIFIKFSQTWCKQEVKYYVLISTYLLIIYGRGKNCLAVNNTCVLSTYGKWRHKLLPYLSIRITLSDGHNIFSP